MITFTLEGLKTPNPLNGGTGNTKLAGIIKSRRRKLHRRNATHRTLAARPPELPLVVTVTRVAPSRGLDPHDGLGASLKGVIDGIADALGVDDRDPRVIWRLEQRRGPWAVEVRFMPVSLAEVATNAS